MYTASGENGQIVYQGPAHAPPPGGGPAAPAAVSVSVPQPIPVPVPVPVSSSSSPSPAKGKKRKAGGAPAAAASSGGKNGGVVTVVGGAQAPAAAAAGIPGGGDGVDDLPCTPDDEDLNTPYPCEHCNKTIKGRVMLQAHHYQEHYDNPELGAMDLQDKHACRVCLKLFTRNSDVKAHILRVHCGDRRYPCTMCGKRFKESTHLRKHLYTHTGERRSNLCNLCCIC